MKTIVAKFPAKTVTAKNGQKFTYAASETVYTQDHNGVWSMELIGHVLEQDVTEDCKKAANWAEIRREHFPMVGFHN